ncbi:MAG: ribosome biogenesis GTPase Der [Candidatus Marinimicrobia bacterium]|nr:ribosome biogenesis GTPase Der [Candidatus Neomarinimicrobiota bacterium]MCF7827729.1 ribosome biogenesis GTPase Der [Candidatus Neomarinimicrobiota bacterium]MCF7881216.1 ribosome biogenesis GTPase Der [Candidatus Neomarinimicrobiota bacterium]
MVTAQEVPITESSLTVAVVGRPNVGKSTLFNRLTGQRQAITSKIEGTTRDRIYGNVDWAGHTFTIIDTGGYIPRSDEQIDATVRRQVEVALEQADFILFVVDAATGITSVEQELANELRSQAERVLVVVNKVDSDNQALDVHEFWNLGLGEPIGVSAESGRLTGDLLDRLVERFPEKATRPAKDPDRIPLAIVGMPNVGKSSFTNAILNEEVSIVTDIPGTTRDTVHSDFTYYEQKFRLIDTAGLRKRSKIAEEIEYYSLVRTYQAIDSAAVGIVIVDADKGFSRRDAEIIRYVLDKKKGLVIAVNKWDLIEKETNTAKIFQDDIVYRFPELEFYPFVFISVLHRQRLYKPIKLAAKIYEERGKSIKTSALNDYLQEVIDRTPPPRVKGKFVRIKYVTQVKSAPPVFAFFVNDPSLIPEHYRRFLEHKIREKWSFFGVPLTLSFRQK